MHLQLLIRFWVYISLFVLPLLSFGQGDSTRVVSSPYKTEYNPWFKLTTYQRGFDSEELKRELDNLEAKPRRKWSRIDSLNFAETSLKAGELELSNYYFNNLNVDYDTENDYWWSFMILNLLNGDYHEGIENMDKNSPGILEFSKLHFLDRLFIAYRAEAKTPKWYKENSIFNWEVDSTLLTLDKDSPEFEEEIIKPLQNLDEVLKLLIHYIHDDDAILAHACYEMGVILENYISYTEAYNAYSIGRHYNKWDKVIQNALKGAKSKLNKNKYKIPIFTRIFPTTEKWRFDYDLLKEKIIFERNDTISKNEPELLVKIEEEGIGFPTGYVTIGGIFMMFLLVLIFLKTRKK